jgi:hypothetical protein
MREIPARKLDRRVQRYPFEHGRLIEQDLQIAARAQLSGRSMRPPD